MKRILSLAAIFLIASARLVWADGDITVTPWGPPDNQSFDHNSPPGDLPKGEDADTKPFVGWTGGAWTGVWDPATSTITITNFDAITVTGYSTIRLPDNADATLTGHEDGHDALNKDEYDKNAKRKIQEAMKGFTGMKFVGKGATAAERQADAIAQANKERDDRLNRARDAIIAQMETLGKKYDDLTKHGTNDSVNSADGQTKAKAERDKAPAAGEHSRAPVQQDPFAASALAQAVFNPNGELLNFQQPVPFTFTNANNDPLLSRGLLTVDPFVWIGPTDTGATHLADTSLQIIDQQTGDVLLQGYLFEPAYMPSSVPGHAGMIQAYLDIPPGLTGSIDGINNTIGSPFLNQMAAARDAGANTTFWFFADNPLFDDQGQPSSGGSSGVALIGVGQDIGVPEPGTLALLALGAGMLAWLHRRS